MKFPGSLPIRFSAPALKIPFFWIKYPDQLQDQLVCLFVTYAKFGIVSKAAIFNMKSWKKCGYSVVAIIHVDGYPAFTACPDLDFCDGILVRKNIGYDFGAWAAGIQLLPDLTNAQKLVCTNDSVIGPIGDFKKFVSLVDNIDADIVGVVESREAIPHVQSFMIFYNRVALKSQTFSKFWANVRSGNRRNVIKSYELTLVKFMADGGLSVKSLFEAIDEKNPTLFHWRHLIESGFPFIKLELIKANPWNADLKGWQELIVALGYDIDLLNDLQLGNIH